MVFSAYPALADAPISEEAAIAQYGQMVHEMQTEAAAIVSDAVTGHTGQPETVKYCPAFRETRLGETGFLDANLSEGTLFIFVSFSMGDEALKSLAASLAKVKTGSLETGSLVMRGLHQNSFQKTALKLKELGICVTIDPAAFERFHVTSVPQFILRASSHDTGVHDTGIHGTGADTLRGNVSLDFALSEFADKGDLASLAKTLLIALRKMP